MGFDVEVFIFNGFKVKLSEAFEKRWLDPSIMEEDDWQYLNMGEDLDRIINEYVNSEDLKNLLTTGWSLYILSSTQSTHGNNDEPYLFIYIDKQEIDCDSEYATGVLDIDIDMKLPFPGFTPMGLKMNEWKYHWVFKSSW